MHSIELGLRGIFCRLDRFREPTVVTDCWVVLPDGCLCDSVPCDGAETGFGFRDRRDMRGGFILHDWHWDGVFCGRESEEFFRRREVFTVTGGHLNLGVSVHRLERVVRQRGFEL